MAAVNWPNVPFYIMSQVNFSDLVVAVNSDNQAVLEPLTGTADQLWVATADERGGARLTNLLSKMALYAQPADSHLGRSRAARPVGARCMLGAR